MINYYTYSLTIADSNYKFDELFSLSSSWLYVYECVPLFTSLPTYNNCITWLTCRIYLPRGFVNGGKT